MSGKYAESRTRADEDSTRGSLMLVAFSLVAAAAWTLGCLAIGGLNYLLN